MGQEQLVTWSYRDKESCPHGPIRTRSPGPIGTIGQLSTWSYRHATWSY
jgi:hypothetical protein